MNFRDYLNESVVGDWQKKIKKGKDGECSSILDGIKSDLDSNKLNDKEFELLMHLIDKKKAKK